MTSDEITIITLADPSSSRILSKNVQETNIILPDPSLGKILSKNVQGEPGAGVHLGGTTGQALIKNSNADYDTKWATIVPYNIIFSGDVTGSGLDAITLSIGAGKVTNSMLAGSIAASKLIGTDITTVGTIITGIWNSTAIDETHGGTNQTSYVLGDTLYASAANTLSKLSGNITTSKMFLSQIGNGSISAAPLWSFVSKSDVGLSNVDNTSDVNKPVSTAQQTALNLKADIASPTFTGTVGGITATMVGLGNVTNVAQIPLSYLDIDGTLFANSDTRVASQKAIKTYADTKVASNIAIIGATHTKITYDSKGLITSATDATTADVADSSNKRYVTDAELTVLGNTSGVNTGDQTNITGNAGTATALQTARNINGVSFDGTANITITADAGTLSGTTLNSTVANSSLTSVGTLLNLTVTNAISGSITGNAATVTTNANLTGPITSTGNSTSVASQTGTGSKFVMDTSPTLVTPILGIATATSINKLTLTQPTTGSILTIDDGFTLHATANATISGTNTGDQDLSGLVPKTTTINGHALSSNVTVTQSDVGLSNVTNVTQLPLSYLDTDGTLAANSDVLVPSQKAVKTYADNLLASNNAFIFKGVIDASGNPNYPAASIGWTWKISVAGKIGGASGLNVNVGDTIYCTIANAGGTQAAVGADFVIIAQDEAGEVIGPVSAVDSHVVFFDGITGKLIKDSGLTLSGANTGDQTNITGNAGTATALQTARTINGVSFDGTANITVTADAGTLSGTTLNATVVSSSLTSVGTLLNLTVTNAISGSITGNAATVTTNANLTGNVTSVGNATTISNGVVTEAMQVLANNTTNDVSITKHGYAPIAPNDATKFLNGVGAYAVPPGTGAATVSNSDGTLTISPTSGAVIASIALGHANTWTGTQTFSTPAVLGSSTATTQAPLTNSITVATTAYADTADALKIDKSTVTTLGDILYATAASTVTRLAGNTSDRQYFLTQTGTGSISAAPSWQPLPTAGIQTYIFANAASDISTYFQEVSLSSYTATTVGIITTPITTTPAIIGNFATNIGFPNITAIPAGVFTIHYDTQKASGGQNYYTYAEIYKRASGGAETLLVTSDLSSQTSVNTIVNQTVTANSPSTISLLSTDRIVVKVYGVMVSNTANLDIRFDDSTSARIEMPFAYVDATNFVPYMGATKNVDLGTKNITANSISAVALINGSFLTASTALVSDASKNIISSATTATELGYVSGVTSSIQTQLNTLQTQSILWALAY